MIFVDSGWWVAWWMPGNEHHEDAKTMGDKCGHEQFFTTNQVVNETATWFHRRAGDKRHTTVAGFLAAVEELKKLNRLVVHFLTEEEEAGALEWMSKRGERKYSFVDASSFLTMRARKIREVLTFDSDFEASGFGFIRIRP